MASAGAVTPRVPPENGDWSVEIGPLESQGAAETLWRTIQADFATVLNGLRPDIQAAPSGARLRLGPIGDFDAARDLCSELAGAVPDCKILPY